MADRMPTGMMGAAAVGHARNLYILGGHFFDPNNNTENNSSDTIRVLLNTVFRYDTVGGGDWEVLSPMKQARTEAAATARLREGNYTLLVCGGRPLQSTCEEYDVLSDKWKYECA